MNNFGNDPTIADHLFNTQSLSPAERATSFQSMCNMDYLLGMFNDLNIGQEAKRTLKSIKNGVFPFFISIMVAGFKHDDSFDKINFLHRSLLLYQNVNSSTSRTQIAQNLVQYCIDTWPHIAKHVVKTAVEFFLNNLWSQLPKFGLRAEANCEESLKDFWDLFNMKNQRSVFSTFWNIASLACTLSFISNVRGSISNTSDLQRISSFIAKELDKRGKTPIVIIKDFSIYLAQITDWFNDNLEFILNCEFDKISWHRPYLDSLPTKITKLREDLIKTEESTQDLLYRREKYRYLKSESKKLYEGVCKKMNSTFRIADQSSYKRIALELEQIIRRLDLALNPQENKEQPFTIGYIGPPCMGKSYIAAQAGKVIQRAFERDPNTAYHNNYLYGAKFQEAFTSNTDIILLDDLAQDLQSMPNSQEFIAMANTPTPLIIKAEAAEKKAHKYRNCGVIITSNREDMGLQFMGASEPTAITRRVHLVVKIEPSLPQYIDPQTGGLNLQHSDLDQGFNPNAVKMSLYTVNGFRNRFDSNGKELPKDKWELDLQPIDNWKRPGSTDITDHLNYIHQKSSEHYIREKKAREKLENEDCQCKDCGLSTTFCYCVKDLKAEATLSETFAATKQSITTLTRNYSDNMFTYLDTSTNFIFDYSRLMTDVTYRFLLTKKIQVCLFKEKMKYMMYMKENYVTILSLFLLCNFVIYLSSYYTLPLVITSTMFINKNKFETLIPTLFACYIMFYNTYLQESSYYIDYINNFIVHSFCFVILVTCSCISRYIQQGLLIRQRLESQNLFDISLRNYNSAVYGSTICLGVFTVFKICQYFLSTANLSESIYDPAAQRRNPFKQVHKATTGDKMEFARDIVRQLPRAATTTARDLMNKSARNVFKITVIDLSTGASSTARAIGHQQGCITVRHLFPREKSTLIDVIVERVGLKVGGISYNRGITTGQIIDCPNTDGTYSDICYCPLPNTPPSMNILDYLAVDGIKDNIGAYQLLSECGKNNEFIPVKLASPPRTNMVQYEHRAFGKITTYHIYNAENNINLNSETGMCGSIVYHKDKALILGMHIAGSGTYKWKVKKLQVGMFTHLHDRLKSESLHFTHNLIPERFDMIYNKKNLEFDDEIKDEVIDQIDHNRRPFIELGYLKDAGQLAVAVATPWYFSSNNPHLTKIWGEPLSRPPVSLNSREAINTTLEKLADPADMIEINYIIRATVDYLQGKDSKGIGFSDVVHKLCTTRSNFFSVRSIEEATRGDGTSIIRGIPNGSSSGLPFGGKKKKYYEQDVEEGLDWLEQRNFIQDIQEVILEQEALFREGRETCEAFMRHSKANELLPWKKAGEKTRSFYSNNMVFFINARRAGIPIQHVLRDNRDLSECFVGLSAESLQWEQFLKHISNNGEFTNYVCGDYKGFDTRISKAVLEQVAQIFLTISSMGGMSDNDLTFLRSCLGIIISPIIVWEGHVIKMANGQPSGQPFTVEMNSVANSLLVRAAYYKIMDLHYPQYANSSFRDYVKLATYGDDNAMGISEKIPKFNHTTIQSVMKGWGIDYTMADKGATSVPYIPLKQVSFLKRSPVFNPEVGLMAPIEEESFKKTLYYYVRPSNTPLTFREQFISQCHNASRQAAQYGRTYYDKFARDLEFIRKGTEIYECKHKDPEEFAVMWEDLVLPTYDEILAGWKIRKYGPTVSEFAFRISSQLPHCS